MAIQVFPQKLQNLWEEWNLRIAVLISLSFQIILIFFASERKRSGNMLIQGMIWSSYLLADWIAAFAVGLISSSQGEKGEGGTVDSALAAFWAPFLLLHLGGPDTISAFSLEDNELWVRHMLGVVVQVLAVGYVFTQSLPNRFWLPTALMFFAGTVKYAERTRALYLACLGNLKDSLQRSKPDPDPKYYAEFMEEFYPNQAAQLPEEIRRLSQPQEATGPSNAEGKKDLGEEEMIQRAYWLYSIFRGLIVDHIDFHDRTESRKFFKGLNAREAFKIVEVELNFLYDALYSKMAAVHYGFFWYVLRFVCSALLVAAFVLFASDHKPKIHRFDLGITYVLLVGAVFLDMVALVKLVFSGWTVALLEHPRASSILAIQSLRRVLRVTSTALAIPRMVLLRKGWSEYLYQHSLISYCLQKRYELVEKTAERFALKEFLEKLRHRKKQNLDANLKEIIFNELKEKTKPSNQYTGLSDKGEQILVDYGCPSSVQATLSDIYSYDQSVLIWHVATDICCYRAYDNKSIDQNRTRCKHLSDYLVYLLIMQPEMMSPVEGFAHGRFHDTNEKARKFFDRCRLKLTLPNACEKLLEADPDTIEMGEVNLSLLRPAVRLAKDLKNMLDENAERTWEMMSKVWLELLLYGAGNCAAPACAQQLGHGGELLSFVWLFTAHFGFGLWKSAHVRYYA